MHPSDLTMFRDIVVPVALALVVACADREPRMDAELARDLQLASQQPANPQFQDVPLNDAPQPRTPPPVTSAPRTTRVPRVPRVPRAGRPAPVSRTPRVSDPTPTAIPETPSPSRAPGILAGTSFGLSTRGQVCTSNLPGDKIVAITTDAVTGENGAYIPAGTTVVLEVTSATPGDRPESAQISLRVRSILIGGEPKGMDGNVTVLSGLEQGEVTKNGGSDKKKVIGGAIAGAVIGQIMGRDTRSTVIGAAAGAAAGTAAAAATRKYHACLPVNGSLRVTTSQPIILSD